MKNNLESIHTNKNSSEEKKVEKTPEKSSSFYSKAKSWALGATLAFSGATAIQGQTMNEQPQPQKDARKYYVYKGDRPMIVDNKTIAKGDTVFYPESSEKQAPALTHEQIVNAGASRDHQIDTLRKKLNADRKLVTYWKGFSVTGINHNEVLTRRAVLDKESREKLIGKGAYIEDEGKNYENQDGIIYSVDIVNQANYKEAERKRDEMLALQYGLDVNNIPSAHKELHPVYAHTTYNPDDYFLVSATAGKVNFRDRNIFIKESIEEVIKKPDGSEEKIMTKVVTLIGTYEKFITLPNGDVFMLAKYIQAGDENKIEKTGGMGSISGNK